MSAELFDVVGVGLNATDTLLRIEEFPPHGGKVAFTEEMLSPGGQVATAMVACSALGLRTCYIGAVGDDDRGRIQIASLRKAGVDLEHLQIRRNCQTQSAYIAIDEKSGERTVFWNRPYCLAVSPEQIEPDHIATARMLHLDGCDTAAATHAARIAREHSIPVSVDVDTIYPEFANLLPLVDYLITSSEFPRKWTGIDDPFRALTAMSEQYGIRMAAVTLGAEGCLALSEGRFFYSPGFAVNCVDTTGAGDVFHGAFCYSVLQTMPVSDALEFSNAMAALNCTGIGARGHIAGAKEVRQFLAHVNGNPALRRENSAIAERARAV